MEIVEISKDLEIVDLGLYLNKEKTLVIGDVHLGFEEALRSEGVLIPKSQYQKTIERLDKMFKVLLGSGRKISRLVINGDLKHEFGRISRQEWNDALDFLDFAKSKVEEVVIIKGNHDKIISPIARRAGLKTRGFFVCDDVLICHGDIIPTKIPKEVKRLIIGHVHPCIGLTDRVTVEKYKAFLKGKWKNFELIIMPSFNLIVEGTDVLREQVIGSFLDNSRNFECWLVADKIFYFGKLRNFS